MARKKKTSKVLEKAEKRLAGLESIGGNLELGRNLSLASYREKISEVRSRLEAYNTALAASDAALNAFQAGERQLRDLNERVLAGVASNYGTDSTEYEAAGGKRRSERKRRPRKSA